jgi:17beta-estradiol 17-dehydrogenase / very-long-chain 3-oxoacyl-CoA reductase
MVLELVFSAVGAITIAFVLYQILDFLHLHLIRSTDLKQYGCKDNSWAVVTGSREGVGKGFAEALAKKGFNVVLTARKEAQLIEVAKELEAKYNIKTKALAVDSSASDAADKIVAELKGLKVSVLVNNVGVNTSYPVNLADTSDADIENIINVNVTFTSKFTKKMIPLLTRTPGNGRSLIINLSSFVGCLPVPMLAPYSASKAYNDFFSRSLSAEVAKARIDVVSITPHYVVSEMSGFKKPSMSIPTAVDFANMTLKKASYGPVLSPHWHHDLTQRIAKLLPESYVTNTGLTNMQKVQSRYLKKQAEAKSSK